MPLSKVSSTIVIHIDRIIKSIKTDINLIVVWEIHLWNIRIYTNGITYTMQFLFVILNANRKSLTCVCSTNVTSKNFKSYSITNINYWSQYLIFQNEIWSRFLYKSPDFSSRLVWNFNDSISSRITWFFSFKVYSEIKEKSFTKWNIRTVVAKKLVVTPVLTVIWPHNVGSHIIPVRHIRVYPCSITCIMHFIFTVHYINRNDALERVSMAGSYNFKGNCVANFNWIIQTSYLQIKCISAKIVWTIIFCFDIFCTIFCIDSGIFIIRNHVVRI